MSKLSSSEILMFNELFQLLVDDIIRQVEIGPHEFLLQFK